jgi:hypothetical protein
MPLTFQATRASVAPLTVALKVCEVPSSVDTVVGVTVTVMEGGVGAGVVGVIDPVGPPPQPAAHAAKETSAMIRGPAESICAVALDWATAICERGRMHWRNAGEWPGEGAAVCAGDAFSGGKERRTVSRSN